MRAHDVKILDQTQLSKHFCKIFGDIINLLHLFHLPHFFYSEHEYYVHISTKQIMFTASFWKKLGMLHFVRPEVHISPNFLTNIANSLYLSKNVLVSTQLERVSNCKMLRIIQWIIYKWFASLYRTKLQTFLILWTYHQDLRSVHRRVKNGRLHWWTWQ